MVIFCHPIGYKFIILFIALLSVLLPLVSFFLGLLFLLNRPALLKSLSKLNSEGAIVMLLGWGFLLLGASFVIYQFFSDPDLIPSYLESFLPLLVPVYQFWILLSYLILLEGFLFFFAPSIIISSVKWCVEHPVLLAALIFAHLAYGIMYIYFLCIYDYLL